MTEWRSIPGFLSYLVSDDGRVWSHLTSKELRQTLNAHGYFCVSLRRNGETKCVKVHRLVAMAFLPPPPHPRLDAAHNDGNSKNNHFRNLRWATRKENMSDTLVHGTRRNGERHGRAKLSELQVLDIKRRLALRSETHTALSNEYGVSVATISNIARGRKWKHLTEEA